MVRRWFGDEIPKRAGGEQKVEAEREFNQSASTGLSIGFSKEAQSRSARRKYYAARYRV